MPSHLTESQSSTTPPSSASGGGSCRIDEFPKELVDNLHRFRNENLFTDISIYVDGVEFPCHKVILCASSTYFRTMFTCDLKESRLGKVYLENMSPWTMKRLLDYVYTGKIEINLANVIDLLNAALLFELNQLVDKCVGFVLDNIDLNNCVELNLFASMHQLKKLEQYTYQFILDNFMQILNLSQQLEKDTNQQPGTAVNMSSSSFVCLNEKTFSSLIRSDQLNVTREVYVYYAINKWAKHQINLPADTYESLFKHIRLNGLTKDEIEYILSTDLLLQANQSLHAKVKSYYCDLTSLSATTTSREDSNKLGGCEEPGLDLDMTATSSLTKTTRPSTIPRDYFCILYVDQFLFYDFYKSKWDNLAETCVIDFNTHDKQRVINKTTNTDSSCLFNTRLNGYSTCCVDNTLYIFGGHLMPSIPNQDDDTHDQGVALSELELVDTVFKFDPIKNEWSQCRAMPTKRAYHTTLRLTSLNGEDELIFLIYGIHKNPDSNRAAQCFHIDYYNVNTDQWDTIQLDSLMHHHFFYLFNQQFSRGMSMDLIRLQIAQSKLLVSIKSLLYMLNQNCVRCYEFNSTTKQFQALPYFQLPPINSVNNFIISGTTIVTSKIVSTTFSKSSTLANNTSGQLVNSSSSAACSSISASVSFNTGSEPSLNSMLFTWYSSNDNSDDSSPSSVSTSELSSPMHSSNLIDESVSGSGATCNEETTTIEKQLFVKEALIYLLDTQNSVLYEFYPAKNKLKKLPPLVYKHSFDSNINTFILNIKSKIYVTGALISSSETNNDHNRTTGVEMFDPETNTWSVFVDDVAGVPVASQSAYSLLNYIVDESVNAAAGATGQHVNIHDRDEDREDELARTDPNLRSIPLIKSFFKLKMSLF